LRWPQYAKDHLIPLLRDLFQRSPQLSRDGDNEMDLDSSPSETDSKLYPVVARKTEPDVKIMSRAASGGLSMAVKVRLIDCQGPLYVHTDSVMLDYLPHSSQFEGNHEIGCFLGQKLFGFS
jgi:hypothetical protein